MSELAFNLTIADDPPDDGMSGLRFLGKSVIDTAIRENALFTWLMVLLSTLAALVGLFLVVWSVILADSTISKVTGSVSGTLLAGLLWPGIAAIRRTRQENMSIRILQLSLYTAKNMSQFSCATRELAAKILSAKWKDGK